MSEVDRDARETAYKVLTIMFIIGTSLANLEFAFRGLRSAGAFNNYRLCMKLTLAFGNILMALFPYTVNAIKLFQRYDSDLTCRTSMLASEYFNYFYPFVIGIALILMAVCKLPINLSSWNPKIRSFLMSAVPWLFGVLVMCPLAFSGTDWDNCLRRFNLGRLRALEICGVCIPAVLAVIFSVIFKNSKMQESVNTASTSTTVSTVNTTHTSATARPGPSHHLTPSPSGMTPSAPPQDGYGIQAPKQDPFHENPPSYNEVIGQQNQPFSSYQPQPQVIQHPPQNQAPVSQQYYSQQYPQQYPTQQLPPQQYPTQQLPPQQYPTQQFPLQQVTGLSHDANSSNVDTQMMNLEKNGIYKASLIFFFSSLPLSLFYLGYIFNEDREDLGELAFTVIFDVSFWVRHLYPLLIPFAWRRQYII